MNLFLLDAIGPFFRGIEKGRRACRRHRLQRLLHEGKIASFRETKFQPMTYFGTPEMIEKKRQDYLNPTFPLPQTLQS